MSQYGYGIGLSLLTIVITLLLVRFSRFLLDKFSYYVIHKTKTELDNVILNAINFPLRTAVGVLGFQIALWFLAEFGLIYIEWGRVINRIFFFVYLVLTYVFLLRLIGGLIDWYGRTYVHIAEGAIDDQFLAFFRHLAYIVLTVSGIIIMLGRLDIEVSALVTTLGIGSLAIALAAQATLGDIIAGFMIVIDRPFRVGDRVHIMDIDTWGDVTEVGLRSTRILTRDNRLVSVPNSVIGKGLVVNYSVPNTYFRVETHVGVAYGTDIDEARQLLVDAIRAEPWVMQERPVEALFLEFGDSALIFRVRCWIEHFIDTRRIIDKMNTAIYHALNKKKIVIPFPQRDLHLRSTVQVEGSNHRVDGIMSGERE